MMQGSEGHGLASWGGESGEEWRVSLDLGCGGLREYVVVVMVLWSSGEAGWQPTRLKFQ